MNVHLRNVFDTTVRYKAALSLPVHHSLLDLINMYFVKVCDSVFIFLIQYNAMQKQYIVSAVVTLV